MNPYDAPSGTVWVYIERFRTSFGPDITKEEYFVVLPGYTDDAPGQIQGVTFRQYLDLETGEIGWFMEKSHFNERSQRFQ